MLTRLYIDNFRCFSNFEYRPVPAGKQLILGSNGTGKTSLLYSILLLRQFAVTGNFLSIALLKERTRWLAEPRMTFELEATLDGSVYAYRVVIEPWGDPPMPRVASETVHLDGTPIFEFVLGEVRQYNDSFEPTATYPFDWRRTALATIVAERNDNQKLARFKHWLTGLLFFRINPFVMGARAEGEDLYPNVDVSNIAAWYRHLYQADPKQNAALLLSLRATLEAFSFLQLEAAGGNVRMMTAEFTGPGGRGIKFGLDELSEGQRCLICLYMILHFVLAKGQTVIIDEPDNFISLREIQPWLMATTDMVDDGHGQLLLISHHPEIINQLAPNSGVQLVRDGMGPVRVERFKGDGKNVLSPAELVARGWERE